MIKTRPSALVASPTWLTSVGGGLPRTETPLPAGRGLFCPHVTMGTPNERPIINHPLLHPLLVTDDAYAYVHW